MNNKIKVAVCCRVAREDDEIIKEQEAMIRRFAEENDYINISVYADNGFNGLNFNRPAFKRLNDDISAGLIETVIVKDISRLSRNYIDVLDWVDNIRDKGVSFISVLDDFTALKEINNALIQAFNAYQAKQKKRNHLSKKRYKK